MVWKHHNIIIGNQGYNNLILRHEPQNIILHLILSNKNLIKGGRSLNIIMRHEGVSPLPHNIIIPMLRA